MIRKLETQTVKDSFWKNVVAVSVVLFFVYLGDAILSDWVPAFIQSSIKSSFLMGLIISFSSVVGFVADMIFPQILKGMRARRMFLLAIGSSLIFCGVLIWSIPWPMVVIFLLAMAIWGIYYELLSFGKQGFVSDSIPLRLRSGAWAIISVFQSLAYFLGPIVGSWLTVNRSSYEVVMASAFFVFIGYIVWLAVGKTKANSTIEEPTERVNIVQESKHWFTLFEHVWPALAISLVLGIVDATFWTTGTVLSDTMAQKSWLGGMFLPIYMLPSVFVGLLVAKWGIYKGKKKIAEIFMLLVGIFLIGIGWSNSMWLFLMLPFGVGVAMAVCWPLIDAVYSDVVSRMGREGKHMMGLSSSTVSLAYIVGPVLVGYVAGKIGELKTFSVVGVFVFIVAVVLLFVTPKKLKLPQTEIQAWEP